MKKISKAELTKKLKRLSGWKLVKGRSAITKTFKFNNFQEAFGWMTSMAIYAEKKIIIQNGLMSIVLSKLLYQLTMLVE